MSTKENFEGSLILEKLAEIDKVDDFYEAVDSDDFPKIKALLQDAQIEEEEIRIVFKMILESHE